MDRAALAALGDQRIDWRFKGFPSGWFGATVAEVVAARPPIAGFATPLLVLDEPALAHNLATMARFCTAHGVDLAPHAKTTMAPRLIARQLDAGAWGVTAATIAHVRAYRAFGVETVLLANQLVDPDGLGWVARELRRDPAFRLLCFADSVDGVRIMQAALDAADAPRPVDVIIDLGRAGARTGVRDPREAEAVARAVRSAGRLRLVGAGGFEGALARDRSPSDLSIIRGYVQSLRALVEHLDGAGLLDEADEIIATAGGSAYFDEVASGLRSIDGLSRPVRVVLRSGAYVTHDHGHYTRLTPLPEGDGFRPALRLRGRVLSRPEPGLALLDFGKRDAPMDLGLPVPLTVERAADAGGPGEPLAGATVTALADQHAFVSLADGEARLAVGDVVTCGISHPCTAFDKWQLIPVVEDGHVVDIVKTFF